MTDSTPRRNFFSACDQLSACPLQDKTNLVARGADRLLLLGLILFALSLPHSIAATYISLSLCALGWIVRDVAMRQFHWARTPFDGPILCFAGLTILSAIFSVEPQISWPKTRALLVFLVLYLCVTNLHKQAVNFFLGLLLISSLVGVLFSLGEKIIGRGMIVTTIYSNSPLANHPLQTGDVIWMINRTRVNSLIAANEIIKQSPTGKIIEIEALHAGDPLPIELKITDELKAQADPLAIQVDGRSRRFRVSGFSRHFLTYAEQMQIFGLLIFGFLIAPSPYRRVAVSLIFGLFALALILTASRGVIAAFLLAIVITTIFAASRRIALITLLAALFFGSIAGYVLMSTRTSSAINFSDDSSARRLEYMKAGLRLIPQHPLLGVGMDAHKKHFNEWGFPGTYITHTHSTPIQIAMERGLPALGCYLWLLFVMGLLAWRGYTHSGDGLSLGAFAALLGFFFSSLTNYNFGDSEVVMLLLFIFALVIKKGAMNNPHSLSITPQQQAG